MCLTKLLRMANKTICGRRSTMSWGNPVGKKGHFVFYSVDNKRFVVPLAYLNTAIFKELLKLAEAEFGLRRDGPITLPFSAAFLDRLVSLL